MQGGTTKDQGLYNKPSAAVYPGALAAGTLLQYSTMLPFFTRSGSLIIQTRTTDTFLFISHITNALLFKFRSNIFIGVRIIKEMPGSLATGTNCESVRLLTAPCWRQIDIMREEICHGKLPSGM